ncbi:BFH_collapsed_G0021300.mRNA.1.CDS.1 [Saccharomyces cerevisiae]|nr:BFH_collapsed_G0021300.mRNA.1.CDS.1 [Saccharomyces cerevisiae]
MLTRSNLQVSMTKAIYSHPVGLVCIRFRLVYQMHLIYKRLEKSPNSLVLSTMNTLLHYKKVWMLWTT